MSLARSGDPQTSHDAAATVNRRASHVLTLRAAQRAMRTQGGYMRDELRLFMSPEESRSIADSRIRTACKELCEKGFMYVTGEKWHTPSGRTAQVLRLTEKGETA